MKRLLVLLACSLLIPAVGLADSVSPGDQIKITKIAGTLPGGLFDIEVDNGTSFISFCLERDESIPQGSWVDVHSVSNTALLGGINTDSGDPLDAKTAWLYLQFRNGALTGYDGSDASVDGLQAAIWFLEEEGYGTTDTTIISAASDFIALANAASTEDLADALARVQVVNPINSQGQHLQSVLTLVPEPATLLLLGTGLLGVGILSRRRQ